MQGRKSGSVVPGCVPAAERGVELGDVILASSSSRKLLTQIPYVTLPLTPWGTKSLLHYTAEPPATPLLLELSFLPVGKQEVAGTGWRSAVSFPCLCFPPLFSKLPSHVV